MTPPAPIPPPSSSVSSAVVPPPADAVAAVAGVVSSASATQAASVSVKSVSQEAQVAPSAVQSAPVAATPFSHVQVNVGAAAATQLVAAVQLVESQTNVVHMEPVPVHFVLVPSVPDVSVTDVIAQSAACMPLPAWQLVTPGHSHSVRTPAAVL